MNGNEIYCGKDQNAYYEALMQARRINKQLGYGNDEKNWDRIRYENDRRNMNYMKRMGIKIENDRVGPKAPPKQLPDYNMKLPHSKTVKTVTKKWAEHFLPTATRRYGNTWEKLKPNEI